MKNNIVTVKRLMDFLKTLPANMPIVISSDEEGNNFSPLTDYGFGGPEYFNKELNTIAPFSADDRENASVNDKKNYNVQALIIYPSN